MTVVQWKQGRAAVEAWVSEHHGTCSLGMSYSSLELHLFIPERADVCCWSSLDNTTIVKLRLQSVLKFRIMRVIFSASWIFQGWITHFVLALCTQVCFCEWTLFFNLHRITTNVEFIITGKLLFCTLFCTTMPNCLITLYSFQHFVAKMFRFVNDSFFWVGPLQWISKTGLIASFVLTESAQTVLVSTTELLTEPRTVSAFQKCLVRNEPIFCNVRALGVKIWLK